MNERIKELVDKIWAEEYWINPNTDKLLPAQLNRFAELIIKEAVRRINGCHLAEGYDPTIVGDFELGYKKGLDKAASQVLKHFGVE